MEDGRKGRERKEKGKGRECKGKKGREMGSEREGEKGRMKAKEWGRWGGKIGMRKDAFLCR